MNRYALSSVLLLALAAPLTAQQPAAPQRIDRILAFVGDSIIFEQEINDDVEARLAQMRANGQNVEADDTAAIARIRRDLLSEQIDRLVLVQAALRDSTLAVDETALSAEVEKQIEERRKTIGGQEAFEAALLQQRLTYNEYREMLSVDLRKQMLSEQYLRRVTANRRPPPVSDRELRLEFDREKSRFPQRPPTITWQQVVILPRASDAARARAKAKADSLLTELRTGSDFATVAKRSSDDGSREAGGDLGWARPTTYVKEFADALSYLRPGEMSPVVETQFGYHIIKLEKVRGAERQARHILVKPESAADDGERALERGREIAARIKAGADVDSLHRQVGDPAENSRMGPVDRNQLPQLNTTYAQNLAESKTGDVVGPFSFEENGVTRVVVVKVIDTHVGGEYTIDDPILNFRRRVEQRRLIDEIVEEVRQRTYIEIRN